MALLLYLCLYVIMFPTKSLCLFLFIHISVLVSLCFSVFFPLGLGMFLCLWTFLTPIPCVSVSVYTALFLLVYGFLCLVGSLFVLLGKPALGWLFLFVYSLLFLWLLLLCLFLCPLSLFLCLYVSILMHLPAYLSLYFSDFVSLCVAFLRIVIFSLFMFLCAFTGIGLFIFLVHMSSF